MRAFAALVAAATALVIGMATLSQTIAQTDTNSTAANETAALLEGVSTGWIEPLAANMPLLAVVALVVLGSAVLVAASRGR